MRTLETLEIVGGALCLDFANTINSRHKPEHDYLQQYSDLAEWAGKVEILSPSKRKRLLRLAEQDSKSAEAVLLKALRIRELLYQIFSKNARPSGSNQEDMGAFVKFYADAMSHSIFVRKGNYFAADWPADESLDAALWPILYSAGQLLLSEELIRVKECPNCGWLFLDTSKNQSRRWCSMNTCGARDKMRRYLRRKNAK